MVKDSGVTCPKCGAVVLLYEVQYPKPMVFMFCSSGPACGMEVVEPTEKQARKAWERKASEVIRMMKSDGNLIAAMSFLARVRAHGESTG